MTIVRGVLLLCAVMALADGAVWEAVGIAAAVFVMFIAWPEGVAQRPVGLTVWWPGARWRRR